MPPAGTGNWDAWPGSAAMARPGALDGSPERPCNRGARRRDGVLAGRPVPLRRRGVWRARPFGTLPSATRTALGGPRRMTGGSGSGGAPGWDEPARFAPRQPWGDPNDDYAEGWDAPAGAARAGGRAPAGPAGPRAGRPPAGPAARSGSDAGTVSGAAGERGAPGSPSGWGPRACRRLGRVPDGSPPGADSVAGGKKRDKKAKQGRQKAAKARPAVPRAGPPRRRAAAPSVAHRGPCPERAGGPAR
jgi:hypothetical protein